MAQKSRRQTGNEIFAKANLRYRIPKIRNCVLLLSNANMQKLIGNRCVEIKEEITRKIESGR